MQREFENKKKANNCPIALEWISREGLSLPLWQRRGVDVKEIGLGRYLLEMAQKSLCLLGDQDYVTPRSSFPPCMLLLCVKYSWTIPETMYVHIFVQQVCILPARSWKWVLVRLLVFQNVSPCSL